MAKKNLRSLQTEDTVSVSAFKRDTSSLGTKIHNWLKQPQYVATSLMMVAAGAYMIPSCADAMTVGAGLLSLWALKRREDMPIKLPVQARMPDMKEGGKNGQGIFFFGNRHKDGKQLWLTNDDCRQHFLVLGTTGSGKSLPNDARVHTPTGWKAMGDVRLRDWVSTPDGRIAQVSGVYPQGELDIYEVEFEDGRVAEACPQHLWEVHHEHWDGKVRPGVSRSGMAGPRLLRTLEVKELLERHRHNPGVKFSVRLAEPVEKPVADLPLAPYLVGAFVGNAMRKAPRFASGEAHVLEAVGGGLPQAGHEMHEYPSARPYYRDVAGIEDALGGPVPARIRTILRSLDLDGKGAHEVRIPRPYLEGSVEQRWELLRGLMDADGTAAPGRASLSYTTSSDGLAEDVQELVRSLGGIARKDAATTECRGADGESRDGRPSHRISMRHPDPARFFSLPRECGIASGDLRHVHGLRLRFEGIRLKRRAQATCIRVDHPDHLFITDNYVVTHNTETLLGFVTNAMTWSSGFLFCDGKGDVALFAKVFALARRFGREDDLLVLNMMTGNANVGGGGGKLLSNTLNPFSTGSADNLTQLVVGLMDDAGGDGAMWKGRATAMFTGVMRALTALRDDGVLDLNVGAIRDHLNLKKIIDLCDKDAYPTMATETRESVKSYLTSLPGYQEEKKYKQAQTTLDQHGYLEMQFTKILGSLADVYGHIFKTPYGEIDMQDVVLNRRILVVMLPALEKSGDELANLGKIVVATLKGMMGGALGNKIEGDWQSIVENRVTNSPSPFLCVLDEVGYYTVEGLALMAAQARSLGFSMIYASQDIPAMKRLNEKEAASIIANTNTKIFMRTEEMDQTVTLATNAGGEGVRAEVSGYSQMTGDFTSGYKGGQEARLNQVKNIDILDLKGMDAGEMLVMYKAERIFGTSFYANPPKVVQTSKLKLRANHFIKIPKPNKDDLESADRLPLILELLLESDRVEKMEEEAKRTVASVGARVRSGGDAIAVLAGEFAAQVAGKVPAKDAGCAAVYAAMAAEVAKANVMGERLRNQGRSAQSIVDDIPPADPRDALPARPQRAAARAEPPHPDAPFPSEDGFDDPFAVGRETHGEGLRGRNLERSMPEDIDLDNLPSGSLADFDPMADYIDDAPDERPRQRPAPPRGPRKQTQVRRDTDHAIAVDDRRMPDTTQIDANDAVLRVLADLDYDPVQTSVEEVEDRVASASGSPTDRGREQMAEADEIDHTAFAAADAAETSSPTEPSESMFISDILADLIDE